MWLLVVPAVSQAQDRAGSGLLLEDVFRHTLAGNLNIESHRLEQEANRGDLLGAGAPFATDLRLSVSGERERGAALPGDSLVSGAGSSRIYRLGMSKRLRWGVVLHPDVRVVQAHSGSPTNSVDAGLAVTVPLLRDRWGAISTAAERAAEARHRAVARQLQHAIRESIHGATVAYWSYLRAGRRLAVRDSSEMRAQRMVEEMRLLVQAQERPAADLNQLLANVATKRIARIAAERELWDARRQLGVIMGISAAEVRSLPRPGTELPRPVHFDLSPDDVDRLVRQALANRADLAAITHDLRGSDVLLRAARSGLEPQLDLSGSLYLEEPAFGSGFESVRGLFDGRAAGSGMSVRLEYRFPLHNLEARARVMRQSALHERTRAAREDLKRRAETGVVVAVETLRRSVLVVEESRRAVDLYRRAVENESSKYRYGAATILDVLLAEDALTNARLDEVASLVEHAQALADLQFELGTIVEETPEGPVVHVQDLSNVR